MSLSNQRDLSQQFRPPPAIPPPPMPPRTAMTPSTPQHQQRSSSPLHSMNPLIGSNQYPNGSMPHTPAGHGAPAGQQLQSPQSSASHLTLSMLTNTPPSTGQVDYSRYTLQDLHSNPILFRDAMSQSPLFHAMLAAHASTQTSSSTSNYPTMNTSTYPTKPSNALSSTTTSSSTSSNPSTVDNQSQHASPFNSTVTSLLSKECSNVQVAAQSPYMDTKMETKVRKFNLDRLEELQRKIRSLCINKEHIENNRDFLMAYEDISRYLQYVGLNSILQAPNASYNVDHADIMEAMITALFSTADARSIIIQGNLNPMTSHIPTIYGKRSLRSSSSIKVYLKNYDPS